MLRLRGVGALGAAAAATVTPAFPAGVTPRPGDLIVVFGGAAEDSPAPALSVTGYTQIGTHAFLDLGTTGITFTAFQKIASGTETAQALTDASATTLGIYGFVAIYSGANQTTPIANTPAQGTAAAATTHASPNYTPTAVDNWLIDGRATADDNALSLTTAQGFTADASGSSYHSVTGNDMAFGLAHKLIAALTAQTMPTWTQTLVGPDAWAYKTFEIAANVYEWEELANGGADGVAVSTSNSTLTGIAAGGIMTYSTDGSVAPNAQRHFKFVVTAGNGTSGRLGIIPTSGGQDFFRYYFRMSAIGTAVDIWRVWDNVGSANRIRMDVNATGHINFRDGDTNRNTSTKILGPYEWIRVEVRLNSLNNTLAVRYFWGDNLQGTVPDEETTGLTWTPGAFDEIRFGPITTWTGTMGFDALVWNPASSTNAWPGPDPNVPNLTNRNQTGSLAVAFSNSASGARSANGDASLAVAMSNSATGAVVPGAGNTVSGDGSLAVAFSNSAAGQRQANGSASLAVALANTATGVVERNGSASLAVAFSNSATPQRDQFTTASLPVSLANSATGVRVQATTAALSVAFSNTASGTAERNTTASLAIGLSNSATGALIKSGSASLAIAFSDSADGSTGSVGVLAIGFANSAAGQVTRSGQAALSIALSDSAAGTREASTTASLAVTLADSATGAKVVSGSASLAVAFSNSTTATAGHLVTGTAALPVAFSNTATAAVIVEASAALVIDVTMSASGAVPGAATPTVGQLWPRGG